MPVFKSALEQLKMDVEKLISEVYLRPAIWDKSRNDHANRNVLDKVLKEISHEMNLEGLKLSFFSFLMCC